MIKRDMENKLYSLSRAYPIVTITGPRQSGKTTLAKMCFPNHKYISLENSHIRQMAETDPVGFLASYPPPVIFDEIQKVPSLLGYIQTATDFDNAAGQYILTGSHQPLLNQSIAQSLAGRTGILCLLPLSISELKNNGIDASRDTLIYNGFMPRLYDNNNMTAKDLYRDYFLTYIERDVRQIINIKNIRTFESFIYLLVGRIGQPINLSSMAAEIGVSSQTLSSWLSVLEASYIIFQLPCYYDNFGKRYIKNRKLYFTETGLATWLLGINNINEVKFNPIFGGLFENMIVIEALKSRYNKGEIPNLFFLRNSQGFEIDLIFQKSYNTLIPMEIKASSTWNKDFAKNIRKIKQISPKFTDGYVIYSGENIDSINGTTALNFGDAFQKIM